MRKDKASAHVGSCGLKSLVPELLPELLGGAVQAIVLQILQEDRQHLHPAGTANAKSCG